MDPLRNYRVLLERVDALCASIEARYADQIACRKGCDSCCRHLSLTAIEAAALTAALEELPTDRRDHLVAHAAASPDDVCPLLSEGSCLLYEARPLICRTHGLPLIVGEDAERRTDCCPRNFTTAEALPGDAVIDLDKLNPVLAAINLLYVREAGLNVEERRSTASIIRDCDTQSRQR